MKQSHCIEDTAGFAEGGDAGGQAGGKARSTEAYRLLRGPLFSKKNHSAEGLGLLMSAALIRGTKRRTTAQSVRSLQQFLLDPPCSSASF